MVAPIHKQQVFGCCPTHCACSQQQFSGSVPPAWNTLLLLTLQRGLALFLRFIVCIVLYRWPVPVARVILLHSWTFCRCRGMYQIKVYRNTTLKHTQVFTKTYTGIFNKPSKTGELCPLSVIPDFGLSLNSPFSCNYSISIHFKSSRISRVIGANPLVSSGNRNESKKHIQVVIIDFHQFVWY